jgi:hypothetical protein
MISRAQKLLRQPWTELDKKEPIRRTTELGKEKRCSACKEWWPEDTEFFTFISTLRIFHSRCKACMAAETARRRACSKVSGRIQSPDAKRTPKCSTLAEGLSGNKVGSVTAHGNMPA